jgi:hypothetical protein
MNLYNPKTYDSYKGTTRLDLSQCDECCVVKDADMLEQCDDGRCVCGACWEESEARND